MDCNGHVTDICESSPPERRSSARIQKLKSEKALRASPKEKEEPVNKKTVKVFKRRKMEEPIKKKTRSVGAKVAEIGVSKLESQVAVLENGVSKLETEVTFPENGISKLETEVAVPNERKNIVEGGEMVDTGVNGTIAGGDKSAYAMVTETLRIFNKHYLHFVQKGGAPDDNTKQAARRPDLKALTKMKETNTILYPNKQFGSIPGVDVGHQFFSRAEMVAVGCHSHWLNGIDFIGKTRNKTFSGNKLPLTVSIVLSGQYEDDLDNCDDVVYTGQGGNNLRGNKRQISDQVMELGNLGLKNCMEQCVPVRVVRGHQCKSSYVGKVYTYDGLYKVVNYWAEKGVSGYTVYKFRLKRLEGQPSLTTNQVQFVHGKIPKSISDLRGLVCEDISGGQETIPIPASNLVDEPPIAPTGFTYCNSIQISKSVKLPMKAPGCNCKGNCVDPKSCACAKLNGSDFPYVHRDGGRLIEPKAVVFECGPNCGCGPGCVNRTSQRGLKYRLEVFRTPKKGWAVRSWDYIPSGAPVCEYIGKLMKTDDLDAVPENNYIFDIDCLQTMKGLDGRKRRVGNVSIPSYLEKDDDKDSAPEFCLDAGVSGNIARFINHSCQPNLFVQCVLSTHHDIKLARVMLFAADNIPPLKELTYDYGYALDSVVGPDGKIKQLLCFCGAADCRKRLF